jgi:hypothetical protein
VSEAEMHAVIRRWAYCRCAYNRAPTDPCSCTEADIRRGEKEKRVVTARWDETLWAKQKDRT